MTEDSRDSRSREMPAESTQVTAVSLWIAMCAITEILWTAARYGTGACGLLIRLCSSTRQDRLWIWGRGCGSSRMKKVTGRSLRSQCLARKAPAGLHRHDCACGPLRPLGSHAPRRLAALLQQPLWSAPMFSDLRASKMSSFRRHPAEVHARNIHTGIDHEDDAFAAQGAAMHSAVCALLSQSRLQRCRDGSELGALQGSQVGRGLGTRTPSDTSS